MFEERIENSISKKGQMEQSGLDPVFKIDESTSFWAAILPPGESDRGF